MKFRKSYTAIFTAILILTSPNVISAEEATSTNGVTSVDVKEYSAEGEYRLGDNDTRATAKIKALDDAKRKIAEQIGVYVQGISEMNNFNLTADKVLIVATAMIKVKSEQVNFSENGMLCKVSIVADASVDDKNIAEVIRKILDEDKNKKDPDEELLKFAKIWKYNGHYYKVFDESCNWSGANQRCKDYNGHLVTITSKDEQAAIQNMLFHYGGKKNYYWTGGFSVRQDEWEWITREEFTYSNWADGEPNNDLGNEFILALYGSTGKWNDCPSEGVDHIPDVDFFKLENSGFICEWESREDMKKGYVNFGG